MDAKDRSAIDDILEAIASTERFISGYDEKSFLKDEKNCYAVARAIEIIGEASKRVSPDIRNTYPAIPWSLIAKARDKIIHHYDWIDYRALWDIAVTHLPICKAALLTIPEIQKG